MLVLQDRIKHASLMSNSLEVCGSNNKNVDSDLKKAD